MEQSLTTVSLKRFLAPLLPYITVGIGLLVFHNAWAAQVSYHLGIVLVLLFTDKKIFSRLIHTGHNYKILAIMALLGAAGGLLLYLLWPFLAVPQDINTNLRQMGLTSFWWPYFIAYFILVNPWLEEIYWRGYLGSDSKRIVLNDLWFSGYHIIVLAGKMDLIWLAAIFAVLALAAWFWRQANRWNQGIWASVISHFMADTSIILAIYFMTLHSG